MNTNVGLGDRIARLALGMVIAAVLIDFESLWAFIGLGIVVSAAVGFCPLYKLLGINTVKATDGEV